MNASVSRSSPSALSYRAVRGHSPAAQAAIEAFNDDRLDAFFSSASAGLALFDAEQRYVRVNGMLAEMNGLGVDEHLGRSLAEVVPQLAGRLGPILERVLASGEPALNIAVDGETNRAPGERRHWTLSFFPLRAKNGHIDGVGAIVVEVTELKRAEEQCRETDRRFHDMLQNLELIAMTLDRTGVITCCNDHLLRLTGWSREEVMGRNWFDCFIPASRPDVRALFDEKLLKGELPAHFENPIRTRTGQLREILWNNTTLRDGAGNVVGTASVGEDVTDRRRAEEALRISEQRFRQVAENIREVFWLTSPDKATMLYVSPAYEKVWGRSCASLLAAPLDWLEAVHPDDRARLIEALPRQQAPGYEQEYRIIQPNGQVRWIRDRAFPVRDETGEVYRIAGVAEDITERKLAEASHRASEAHVRALFDSSPIAIGYGTLEGRLLNVNPQLAGFWGYERDELVGRSVQELRVWVNPADRAPMMRRLAEQGVVLNEETQFRHKSGEIRTALMSLRLTQIDQQPAFLAMLVDVTQQKAMEEQLRRVERMESVGRLASGVAHDMNNILAPIMMSAPMLRQSMAPADYERAIARIEVSAQRGADLARQLLTIGRGGESERGAVDLAALLREVVTISAETFPRNIEVTAMVASDLRKVSGNVAQLHQVLLNLCVNARDAMPDGGRLALTAENIRCDDSYVTMHGSVKPGAYIRVAVSDTGQGIPPELTERVFEPFFTTKKGGRGTGLGLSTVASVMKSHGGFVSLRSTPAQGTTFELLLPTLPPVEPPMPEAPTLAPAGHGETILVVEDEEAIRMVLQDTLQRHGYQVVTATDGADALAAFAKAGKEVKVVVADLDMPVLNGINLVRALRRMRPDVRVVISTGLRGDSGVDKRCQELEELSVNATLIKPYTAETLLEAVHRALPKDLPVGG